MMCRAARLGVVLLIAGAGWTIASAMAEDGAIRGRVTSRTGVGITGAIVRIERDGTPAILTRTDSQGWFRCVRPPSSSPIVLRVSAAGYRDSELTEPTTAEGAPPHVEVVLVAQGTESPPDGLIEREATRTATRFGAEFGDRLPIIGHDYQDVLLLAPGVVDPEEDGAVNVHGARATGLQFRLDRGDVTDPVTGASGMNLNPFVVEQLEILTGGAPAEYGRAMGGFANVTTRSGGNDFQGRLGVFWRGRFLDGDGADGDELAPLESGAVPSHDLRFAAAAGGPLVEDRLWYFAGVETLDLELRGARTDLEGRTSSRGRYDFGKLSLRPHPDHALRLQVAADPVTLKGQGLSRNTAADSGFEQERRGVAAGIAWTASLPSGALLEASVSRLDSDLRITPESRFFERVEPELRIGDASTGFTLQAAYPCSVANCSEAHGDIQIRNVDGFSGHVSGPFDTQSDETRSHDALRSELSYPIETKAGDHHVKGGFEIGDEDLQQQILANPSLLDLTLPAFPTDSNLLGGLQILSVNLPNNVERTAANLHTGFYASDSWKPLRNLVVNAGLRLDREDLDAPGFGPFDPRVERRRAIGLWRAFCGEALLQGLVTQGSNCSPARLYDGRPPSNLAGPLRSVVDRDGDGLSDVSPDVAALDLDADGFVDLMSVERDELFKHFTALERRQNENFSIHDTHLSPRVGVSWDPAGDGRTRVFAHWGRYHDRLRTEAILGETDPAVRKFVYFPGFSSRRIVPGVLSNRSSFPSVNQVDRGLRAPRTDELTIGYERELGPAWTVGATYIRRKAFDLLQDVDLNHHTCTQASEVIGIDPNAVCRTMQGELDTDRFGSLTSPSPSAPGFPNGLEDLYTVSPRFNEVLRIGNLNRSDYEAYEVRAVRGLHRGWQMRCSYVYAKGRGEADQARSPVGDDPAHADGDDAALAYDRRHELKFQGVTRLPGSVLLGGVIEWVSGTPFTVASVQPADVDDAGNVLERTLLPTNERNDQRNGSRWRLDGRIEKSFRIRRVDAAAYLIVENLLNDDTPTIATVSLDGQSLTAARDFGRRFEIGGLFGF